MKFSLKLIKRSAVLAGILIIGYFSYQYFFKPHPQDLNQKFLLTTKWSQSENLSKFTPDQSYIGCWPVALSQILFYHKKVPAGSISYITDNNYKVEGSFDNHSFNLDTFYEYPNSNINDEIINEMAQYLFFTSLVLNKNWFGDGYLNKDQLASRMENHFNCTIKEYTFNEEDFDPAFTEVSDLIKSQIDSRCPILYYFDNNDTFGHACVIDGYTFFDSDFLVHLNLGWGGYMDGWYNLKDRFIKVFNDKNNRIFITINPNIKSMAAQNGTSSYHTSGK